MLVLRGANRTVCVDGDGNVAAGAREDARVIEGAWVGPGIVDAHVHLAFGPMDEMLRRSVVAVRDLGAPPALAARIRASNVAVAGPLLTAPAGYPSRSWGADGFARFVAGPDDARRAVRELDADLVKVALEPSGGQPVPDAETVRAIVDAAHARGLAVTAHALTEAMVERALDAGVDELCHTPVEPLSPRVVERVAEAGVPVVSTIECLGDGAARNAALLHAAGVRLVYGTDLGNAGTRTGAEPRELRRLAEAGLGAQGAFDAATRPIEMGRPARVVVLDGDPVEDPELWRTPVAVVTDGRVVSGR
ncbi:MAG TPA: amidohydrolase family protein [Frankiaceae bacterium]|jgi:imidazolonepropionase-like amidohydrolase|nr:amidohydrolase family protein [Frankiaceae bacterium]